MRLKKKMACLAAAMLIGAVPAYASIADEEEVWSGTYDSTTGEVTVVVDKHPLLTFTEPLPNDQVRIVVNNKELTERGVMVEERTLVPLRAIAEQLEVKVDWNASEQKIHMEKVIYQATFNGNVTAINHQVNIHIDDNYFYKDGDLKNLDVPAQIINGKTMVPVRVVAKCFDAEVAWDNVSRTVTIAPTWGGTVSGAFDEALGKRAPLEPYVDTSTKPSDMTYEAYMKSLGEAVCWLNWTPETYIKLTNEKGAEFYSAHYYEGNSFMLPRIETFVDYNSELKQSVLGSRCVLMLLMDNDMGLIKGTTAGYVNDEYATKVDRGIYRLYTLSNIYYSKEGMTMEDALDIYNEVQVPLAESSKKHIVKGQIVYASSYDADKKLVQFTVTKGKTEQQI